MSSLDAANFEKYYPKDLIINPTSEILAANTANDKNNFTFVAPNLKIGTVYTFQFQYVFEDGVVSKWSPSYQLTTASYVSKLTKPVVTVTPASLGYTVSYTKQTDKNFEHAIIEESVSNSNTAPTSGWTEVSVSSTNPTTITVGDTLKRWVRVKLIDKILGNTPYSDPVSVTPVDPVAAALDVTPPSAASNIVASWSGNNILITATVSADAKKFIIRLTNGTDEGFFTKFPSASGTSQSILITQQELYVTFGEYFTSFSGLFVSADSLDNRDSGVSFTVPEKTNVLLGVVPTFTLTGITNGYTATWTLPAGASYAKVYESGTSWGAGDPTELDLVFSGASPAIIKKTVYTLRYVKIRYITDDGFTSSWSAEQSVTPIDAIAADVNAPAAPSTLATPTSGIDTSGTLGFNGYINLSWTAISDTTLRGYRIKFRPYKATAPFENYSYVDSPGTGTTYRLDGLSVGATYEIGIASYDEFNNTSSSYTSFTNTTISGTPSLSNYITSGAAGFQFGSGIKDKDGTQNAAAQGIYLSNNNYWYLTSANSALFKIGGSTSNYVSWDGQKLNVDGDLGVAGGTTIGGNIAMGASGASIYQGTLSSGNLASDGFLLNSGGLVIKKGSVQLRLDTSDGGIYAQYGQIAGWTIDSSKFERGTTGTYTGISSSGTYAIWAGSPVSAGNSSAKFSVTPAGAVTASDITITGGSLTVGATSIAASTGKLIATDAEITGKIIANSGTINGNLDIAGTFFIGASAVSGERLLINSGGIAAYASGDASPRFQLTKDGTGKIGGWTINATSLSSSGMVIDASDQSITFKQGYEIDQESTNIAVVGATSNTGSSGSEDDVPDSLYSSSSAAAASTTSSTLAIRSTSGVSNGGALYLSQSPIAAVLRAGSSSITVTSSGLELNSSTAGAYVFKNLADTSRTHLNFNYVDKPAMLMIKSDGTLSVGRTIFKSGSTETNIVTNGTHNHVGRIGDLIFSTAD
jgi:hypothetical protein